MSERRVRKELADAAQDTDSTVTLSPLSDDSLFSLKGKIRGQKDTPYEGGTFDILIDLSQDYPFKPPIMTFITAIWHPNFTRKPGKICLPSVNDKWSPACTVKKVLLQVQETMRSPDFHDNCVGKCVCAFGNREAKDEYKKDPGKYYQTAREWTAQYASPDRSALLALYNSTDGRNWVRKTNWNTCAALSDWHGVQVNGEGRVSALRLHSNRLRGRIPPELGKLEALETLSLAINQLSGPIPPQLGALSKLHTVQLNYNNLTGPIPPELGNLAALSHLEINGNRLSGGPEKNEPLGTWRTRRQQSGLPEQAPAEQAPADQSRTEQRAGLEGGLLTGGPEKNEPLGTWGTRLQSELPEQAAAEQESADQSGTEQREGLERGMADVAPVGQSPASRGEGSDDLFRAQVASFAALNELTRGNRETLEEVKRLLGQPATAGAVPFGKELAGKLGELESLLAMAKSLGDVASRYTADLDMQRREASFDPGRKAYNVTVRSGLCSAYLAASVVCSGLVSTSKVGVMGKAGEALKLISGSVPLVGGLAVFAGAALKAGDSFIQTRRLEKITDLAPDAVECSTLAKSLALRLTDGLTDGTIAIAYCDANEILTRQSGGVGWGAGGSSSSRSSVALAEEVDEEAVLEWFVEEIASCEPSCGGTTREVQAGRQLGKRHLRKLFTAVGRGCLQGTSSVDEKVNRLVSEVLSEADIPSAKTPNAPEGVFVQSPASAPCHDGLVQQLAAEVKALTAMLKSDKEKHLAEVEGLKGKIAMFEKHLPKSHGALGRSVDAGEGCVLDQAQRIETIEDFNEMMENPARAVDRQTVTPGELRVVQAYLEEVSRETGDVAARVAALEDNQGKKAGPRLRWRGNR